MEGAITMKFEQLHTIRCLVFEPIFRLFERCVSGLETYHFSIFLIFHEEHINSVTI